MELLFLLNHCLKYAEMLAFFDPRFPVYVQNHVLIFPDEDRIVMGEYRSEEARILAYLTLWISERKTYIFHIMSQD